MKIMLISCLSNLDMNQITVLPMKQTQNCGKFLLRLKKKKKKKVPVQLAEVPWPFILVRYVINTVLFKCCQVVVLQVVYLLLDFEPWVSGITEKKNC